MSNCKHEWFDDYYGMRCKLCDTFYPHGCEPWLPQDEGYYFAEENRPEASELSDNDLAEADEVNQIVDELIAQRYPDGPPDDLDWGDLYADAYQLQAERAAVGSPCPKCGAPLPPDLLCECETYQEPSGDV